MFDIPYVYIYIILHDVCKYMFAYIYICMIYIYYIRQISMLNMYLYIHVEDSVQYRKNVLAVSKSYLTLSVFFHLFCRCTFSLNEISDK